MSESPEDRRRALLQLATDRPADFVGMYLAESAALDKVLAERDRARDLAVRAGAFDGPSDPVFAPVRVSKFGGVIRWDCRRCGTVVRVLPPQDEHDWAWVQTDANDHAMTCRRQS